MTSPEKSGGLKPTLHGMLESGGGVVMVMSMLGQILWYSMRLLPVVLAMLLGAVVVVVWTYRGQARVIRGGWRWVLPGLRMMAMGALVLSLLKPTLMREKTDAEQGAVVMLVDQSRSMGVCDGKRTPEQLVGLAGGLGRLKAGVRPEPIMAMERGLDHFRSVLEEAKRVQDDWEYAKLSGRGVEGASARMKHAMEALGMSSAQLIELSKHLPKEDFSPGRFTDWGKDVPVKNRQGWFKEMGQKVNLALRDIHQFQRKSDRQLYEKDGEVRGVCDELAGLSREALVEQALVRPGSGLLGKISARTPVLGFGFAEGMTALPMSNVLRQGGVLGIKAEGDRTDITGAVQRTLDQVKGKNLQAIVLFSDGRQVGSQTDIPAELLAKGVPIFTVGVAPRGGVGDLSVERMTLPRSQFVGETMTVRGSLRNRNLNGCTTTVRLSVGSVQESKRVTIEKDQVGLVEFNIKLEKAGILPVLMKVDAVKGEGCEENNECRRYIKVLSAKLKIAAYSGSANWDFEYVRNCLARTPWVKLEEMILPDEKSVAGVSVERILDEDVFVLHDFPVAGFTDAQWDAVYRLVTERGRSVVLVAGPGHLPWEYERHILLSGFLPYRAGMRPAWRSWPGEEAAFHVMPSYGSGALDALKLDDDGVVSRRRWQGLPPFFRYLALPELKPNVTRTLLVERDSEAPILTESRVGAGRVFFMGMDETWRWRLKIGERDQDRFWLQLMRYAAEEPYMVTEGNLSLDTDSVVIEPWESVRVRARVLEESGMGSREMEHELRILRDGVVVRRETMMRVADGGDGRYEVVIKDLAAGEYQLQVGSEDDAGTSVALPLHVVSSAERELVDVSSDEEMLQRLARASGGEYLRLDEVSKLPAKLAELRSATAGIAEIPLWDSAYLFAFVLSCLAAEWSLRKGFGLA